MRLYYLTAKEWAFKILHEHRLKISIYDELNDPFELLAYAQGMPKERANMKILTKFISTTKGVICFTKKWDNPVMWAHYADKHRGICLGFDVDDDFVYKINYVNPRLSLKNDISILEEQIIRGLVPEMLLTKYDAWEYEDEYRIFDELTIKDGDHYFRYFDKQIVLKEIIIGVRCPISTNEVALALNKSGHGPVKILKARMAFKDFKIVRQKKVPIVRLAKSGPS